MKYDYILIDTSSLFHQFYFFNKKFEKEQPSKFQPLIKNINGSPTYVSTLRSYILKIYELRKEYPNAHIIHALDPISYEENFRKKIDPEYKSNRNEKEEDLLIQLKMLPKLLGYLNQPYIYHSNYEADDIIGTTIHNIVKESDLATILVYSRDKDLLQCMLDENRIHFMSEFKQANPNEFKKEIISTFQQVIEKMKVEPLLIPELLAITGDPTDGIKGIHGLGFERVGKLLNNEKHKNFVGILNNIEHLPENYQKIFSDQNNIDLIFKNIKLTTIEMEANIPTLQEVLNVNKSKDEIDKGLNIVSRILNIQPNILSFLNKQDNDNIYKDIEADLKRRNQYPRNQY